jgi:hypothetical protein
VIYDNTYYKGQEASYCVQDNATGLYYCSMHGLNELREDMRQLCIFRDYGIGTFFNYTAQINNGCKLSEVDTCWKPIAGNSSINATAVEACVESDGLALVKAEKALDDRFGIGGSPSIVINDAVYDGSRAANDLKEALCTGFNSKPSECSQTVSDTGQQAQGGCGN